MCFLPPPTCNSLPLAVSGPEKPFAATESWLLAFYATLAFIVQKTGLSLLRSRRCQVWRTQALPQVGEPVCCLLAWIHRHIFGNWTRCCLVFHSMILWQSRGLVQNHRRWVVPHGINAASNRTERLWTPNLAPSSAHTNLGTRLLAHEMYGSLTNLGCVSPVHSVHSTLYEF